MYRCGKLPSLRLSVCSVVWISIRKQANLTQIKAKKEFCETHDAKHGQHMDDTL